MGRLVGFESWVERGHLVALDFAAEVTAIVSQPFWLCWRTQAGKSRRHAPDFFARLAGGGALVIDSRPKDAADDGARDAFAATRKSCALLGWTYAVCGAIGSRGGRQPRWIAGVPPPAVRAAGGGGPPAGRVRSRPGR